MTQTRVRLAAAAVNTTPLDWEGNLRACVRAVDSARGAGADLVCLPELCLSGYGCEDVFYAGWLAPRAEESLATFAGATAGLVAVVGLPVVFDGVRSNGAAVVADGQVRGVSLKQHLANDGLHYEARWFTPWPAGRRVTVSLAGWVVPAGDLVFDLQGVGVGIEVCRDAWVADRPALRYAERGVSLLLNPSASHFALGKQAIRERLTREGAAAVRGVALYTNLLGNESGRTVFDGGALLAATADSGEAAMVADRQRFLFADHAVAVWDVSVEARDPKGAEALPPVADRPDRPPIAEPTVADAHRSPFEEFAAAVPLGMWDYLRKSGARGYTLSLSGGADSAACAACVWLMAHRVLRDLGPGGLAERMPQAADLASAKSPAELVHALLTTVYQATRNSSDVTRLAASAVAEGVGADHYEWSVDGVVDAYTSLASEALGRSLSWEADDLALQNIQSRARAPGVWLLANLRGHVLLTTGNRSEAAVGYATMDGDTAGGFAPIAGVGKSFLREWLRWMESEGPHDVGPAPWLAVVNAQQPTAELRPLSERQTDEADLMPYDVLDAVEQSVVADLDPPQRTLELLRQRFPDHSQEQLAAWADRFRRLWRVSQWKRERLAPSLHLDAHGLDPRGWRRWPILSGE